MNAKLGLWKNRPWRWRIGLILVIATLVVIILSLSDGDYEIFIIKDSSDFMKLFGFLIYGIIGAILMITSKGKVKKQ